MDWEDSKENFQPLKQGRDPSELKLGVQKPTNIEEQRRALWKAIADYAGDDPIEPWLRLIKWTQNTFKSGGSQAELRPLLERCTRELQAVPRYRSDMRYLRVWIHYADCIPEPQDVFSFLQKHEIGQGFALFYVAYSAFLELRRNFSKAKIVLLAGLDRLAHPVDKLRAKYEAFQARMARRVQRDTGEFTADVDMGENDENFNRSALACIQGPTMKQQSCLGGRRTVPDKENSNGIDVFVDDEFGGAVPPQGPQMSQGPAHKVCWPHLGTFEQTRKENVEAPSKWAGAGVKPKAAAAPPVPPPLIIPMDDDLRAAARCARIAAVPQGTLRNRLDQPGLDESLQADPLKLHKNELLAAAMAKAQDRPPRPPPRRSQPPRSPKKESAHFYADDTHMFPDADGDELSFEEVRAAAWQEANRPAPAPSSPEDDPHKSSSPPGAPHSSASHPASPSPPAVPALHSAPSPQHEQPDPSSGDVTASVRDAFDTINAMFSGQQHLPCPQPVHLSQLADENSRPPTGYLPPLPGSSPGQDVAGQRLAGSRQDEDGEGGALQQMDGGSAARQLLQAATAGDVTIATRNAYDAINSMFNGALDSQVPWHQELRAEHTGALAAACHKAASDPTITLSTKAAFEALGGAFASKFPPDGSRASRQVSLPQARSSTPAPEQPASNAPGNSNQDPTETFAIYEDTQFGGEATGFAIHEDTTLFGDRNKQPPRDLTEGFVCHEDTELLEASSLVRDGAGRRALQPTALGSSPDSAAGSDGEGLSFAVYEDTELL